jgi:hypothetical protein
VGVANAPILLLDPEYGRYLIQFHEVHVSCQPTLVAATILVSMFVVPKYTCKQIHELFIELMLVGMGKGDNATAQVT